MTEFRPSRAISVSPNARLNIAVGLLLILLWKAWDLGQQFGAWQTDWSIWRRVTDARLDALERAREFHREAPPTVQR